MRRSYQIRKLERHSRKPAELLLVPMIDIFTVLVTFLLMTAVFSRTVILQLNLPPPQTEFKEPPPGLQLEGIVRKNLIQVADRTTGSGPCAPSPRAAAQARPEERTPQLQPPRRLLSRSPARQMAQAARPPTRRP